MASDIDDGQALGVNDAENRNQLEKLTLQRKQVGRGRRTSYSGDDKKTPRRANFT